MTEFFHNCTTNERKREIGEFCPFQGLSWCWGGLVVFNTAELASSPLLLRWELEGKISIVGVPGDQWQLLWMINQ